VHFGWLFTSAKLTFSFSAGIPQLSCAKQAVVVACKTKVLPLNVKLYLPIVSPWYSTSISPSTKPSFSSESCMMFNSFVGF
jgi:hypothetical protein